MARYYYNKKGALTGISKSDRDLARESAISFVLIAIAVCLAPLYPIFYVSYKFYKYLIIIGVHPLFGILASAAVVCALLLILFLSKVARVSYLMVATFVGAYFAFFQGSDVVWGSFFSIIVCAVGLLIAGWVSKFDFSSPNQGPSSKQYTSENVSFQAPAPSKKREASATKKDTYCFLEENSKAGKISEFTFSNNEKIEIDPFTAREILTNFTREEINKAAKRELSLLGLVSTAHTRDYDYWRNNPKSRL
jgi:hypothetical protein